jgi:hypothetical protein
METLSISLLTPILVGVVSATLLVSKVVKKLSKDTITVTRADTGRFVILERPTVEQSRANRSAQARKLLDLVEA